MNDPIQLVDLADLVGRAEIAERAGIRLQTVDTWRRRYPDTFPDPIGTISGTPLWLWPAIEAWIEATPRLVGRPARVPRLTPIAPLPNRLTAAIRTRDANDDDPHAPGGGTKVSNDR